MVLANLFHALYVVDFFINEPWSASRSSLPSTLTYDMQVSQDN
jgi:hypothetical protein